MDTARAIAMAQVSRGQPPKVFDWDRAARRIKESRCTRASAGLQGDWEYTGGSIFADGKPVPKGDTYTYLASTWATPELELDGIEEDCFVMQSDSPGWDAHTYWPESALTILRRTA